MQKLIDTRQGFLSEFLFALEVFVDFFFFFSSLIYMKKYLKYHLFFFHNLLNRACIESVKVNLPFKLTTILYE